jgi:hypothetical protein
MEKVHRPDEREEVSEKVQLGAYFDEFKRELTAGTIFRVFLF